MTEDKTDKGSDRSNYFRATPEDFIFHKKRKHPVEINIASIDKAVKESKV